MNVKQKTLTWALSVAAMAMTVAAKGAMTKADAPSKKPNIVIILADDMYSHSMRERCFIHANQRFSWIATDFRTIPNCGQFSPIP